MIPNRTIAAAHETTVITQADGQTVRGLAVRDTAQGVSLLTPEGTVTDIPRAQVRTTRKEKVSIMTETLADSISRDQLRNLAAFLTAPPPGSGGGQ